MKHEPFITRKFIKENRDIIFIYGDNLQRKGYGGQAKECRGEPNAFGIATKLKPYRSSDSYFYDDTFVINCNIIDNDIEKIPKDGRRIIVLNGIGSGLAEMPTRCPKTYEYLCKKLKQLTGILKV